MAKKTDDPTEQDAAKFAAKHRKAIDAAYLWAATNYVSRPMVLVTIREDGAARIEPQDLNNASRDVDAILDYVPAGNYPIVFRKAGTDVAVIGYSPLPAN
jgi:hypothetical protein